MPGFSSFLCPYFRGTCWVAKKQANWIDATDKLLSLRSLKVLPKRSYNLDRHICSLLNLMACTQKEQNREKREKDQHRAGGNKRPRTVPTRRKLN